MHATVAVIPSFRTSDTEVDLVVIGWCEAGERIAITGMSWPMKDVVSIVSTLGRHRATVDEALH